MQHTKQHATRFLTDFKPQTVRERKIKIDGTRISLSIYCGLTIMRHLLLVAMITNIVAFSPPHHQTKMLGETLINLSDDLVDSQRRSWIKKAIALGTATTLFPKTALADVKYDALQDQSCNFQILVPVEWERSEQKLPDRRSITFYIDPSSGEEKTLFFSALTPIRDDFTSLSSFGSVDQVSISAYRRIV